MGVGSGYGNICILVGCVQGRGEAGLNCVPFHIIIIIINIMGFLLLTPAVVLNGLISQGPCVPYLWNWS